MRSSGSREAHWLPGVLACGEGAVLSHRNDLQLASYTTLRFTHADLTHRPAHVVQQIAHALGMKGSRA